MDSIVAVEFLQTQSTMSGVLRAAGKLGKKKRGKVGGREVEEGGKGSKRYSKGLET